MTDSVSFDPGLGKLTIDLYSEIYIIENDLENISQLSRKIRYYRFSYKKIHKAMMNNLAFYNGCLAWAYYIVKACPQSVLTGNPFISLSEEQKKQYAPAEMVDFFIDYLAKYKSDLKYYNIKDGALPDNTEQILSLYREFISLNEGFIKAHKSSDIILPEKLIYSLPVEEIKNKIEYALLNQDVLVLLQL